ncbi:MAG: exo-alpha-sialidase [Puniceicoccaceae bacterium]
MNSIRISSLKKLYLTLTIAGLSLLLTHAGTAGTTSDCAVVQSGFIYETASYPSCHASTIAEVSGGQLVAAWFGGTHERHPDVGIWVARMVDGKWEEATEVANGLQEDGERFPTWNPVLFQPEKGDLFLFYKVGPNPREWWGMVMTSPDAGQTWTEPVRLPDGILGPIKNKPVILPDGTWMSPSSTETPGIGWRVHFELSRDQGTTWEKIGPVGPGVGFDAIQPSILFHPDNTLQALCRTKQGVVGMTWSYDGGQTWTDISASELPNPSSGTDAVTLADGRQLIVYNHFGHLPERSGKGLRYPLNIALSDDGIHWRRVLDLETEAKPAGYAYPAVIQTSDGLIHVTYTWDRKRIKHLVIDPTKIK